MNGDVYSLNMEIVMQSLTKTTFTIFLTNIGRKEQEKKQIREGRDATNALF